MGEFINVSSGLNLQNMPRTDRIQALLLNGPAVGESEQSILNASVLVDETNADYFYLDSGGYEIFKAIESGRGIHFDRSNPRVYIEGVLNITPRHLYEIAKRLFPSVFISLDYPIPNCENVGRQELNYMLTMGFNIKCAREMAYYIERYRNETGESAKFYIALQCYNLTQINDYLRNLENINYEGISIPKRVHTPTSLALFMFHIYRKFRNAKLPDIHLLGSTSFEYLAILAYYARNIFDYVSVDATSWAYYARMMLYVYPFDLRSMSIGDDASLESFEFMRCACPHCSTFESINDLKVQDAMYRKRMLYGHNWWVINEAMRHYYDHAETAKTLNDYLLSVIDRRHGHREKAVGEIYRCLTIIEAMRDNIDNDKMIGTFSQMLAENHASRPLKNGVM